MVIKSRPKKTPLTLSIEKRSFEDTFTARTRRHIKEHQKAAFKKGSTIGVILSGQGHKRKLTLAKGLFATSDLSDF